MKGDVRVIYKVRAVLNLHAVGEPAAARKGMKRRSSPEEALDRAVWAENRPASVIRFSLGLPWQSLWGKVHARARAVSRPRLIPSASLAESFHNIVWGGRGGEESTCKDSIPDVLQLPSLIGPNCGL